MHVDRIQSRQRGRVYEQVLLRESYREPGGPRSAVKKRTLLNLTKYSPQIIAAIELALKHKDDLGSLMTFADINLQQGPSVGAVWALSQVARRLGLDKAIGSERQGKLALWQVIARALDQGSRLSAVRLAKTHAVGGLLGLDRRFDEDDLYENLDWLAAHQEAIENRLFAARHASPPPSLFLYDVTSSYLEGDRNELADWGYNRDKKRGKKQIVIGMLCDQDGEPVSTEVFEGNTSDLATFESQIHKTAERFGCQRVTFVGDRGMIKSGQIEELSRAGFHYITAITKAQIRSLIKKDMIQLGLFDEKLCEAVQDGVRYILRRNPVRAEELAASRASKLETLRKLAQKQNEYLTAHPKADPQRAWKLVSDKQSKLDVASWVTVRVEEGRIVVEVDEERLGEISQLDGCYALKTDLPRDAADPETIHARYKDLALVEMGFRTMKTDHLRVRPVWVRKESRTRAHVLVVMLAYRLIRELSRAWSGMDLKVEEGLDHLKRLCAMELKVKNGATCLRLPTPDDLTRRLLEALDVGFPAVLPAHAPKADSRKKLTSRRKSL